MPEVQAEFLQRGGRWIFVNFLYPEEHTDLLKILRSSRPKCSVPRSSKK
jgi:hypothetical protein